MFMKRMILLLAILAWACVAQAADYVYLTFETQDGEKVSVATSSLTFNFTATTLTIGDNTFVLSNLRKMYFSATNLTTDVSSIKITEVEAPSEIYDLKGRKVSKAQLQQGVYVVKTKSGNYKIAVK